MPFWPVEDLDPLSNGFEKMDSQTREFTASEANARTRRRLLVDTIFALSNLRSIRKVDQASGRIHFCRGDRLTGEHGFDRVT